MKHYRVTIDGRNYDVEIDDPRARPVTARLDGVVYTVDVHAPRPAADAVERPVGGEGPAAAGGRGSRRRPQPNRPGYLRIRSARRRRPLPRRPSPAPRR